MLTEIKKTLEVLKNGGIILYPTDTIWGLGCDATNKDAIAKIYEIKKREDNKALISLVANKKQLREITNQIPEFDITSKPTTVIYPTVKNIHPSLLDQNGSGAIRIVQDKFCQNLIQKFKKPIVSTSANISGNISPKKFSEIDNRIKHNVDYIVNLRKNELMSQPSTIILIKKDGIIKKIR